MSEAEGVAYVEVRPDLSTFKETANRDVSQALRGAGSNVPVSFDKNAVGQQVTHVRGLLSEGLKAVGITLTVEKVIGLGQQAISQALDTSVYEARLKTVFGEKGKAQLDKFNADSIKSFGASHDEAIRSEAGIAAFADQAGVAKDKALEMAKTLTELSGKAALLNPELGGAAGAADKLKNALETGSSKSLKDLGIAFTPAELKDTVRQLGYTTVDTVKLEAATAQVTAAQAKYNELKKIQASGPDARRIAEAQLAYNLALKTEAHELALHSSKSVSYQQATLASARALDTLTAAQKQTVSDSDILSAKAALDSAASSLQDVQQGSLDALQPAERMDVIYHLILQKIGKIGEAYKDLPPDVLAANDASKTWQDTLTEIGKQLAPQFVVAAKDFSEYISKHPDDVKHFAQDLGEAAKFFVSAGEFVAKHAKSLLEVFLAIKGYKGLKFVEGVFGGGKSGGAASALGGVQRVFVVNEGFGGLPGKGGLPGGAGGVGAVSIASKAVNLIGVGTLAFEGANAIGKLVFGDKAVDINELVTGGQHLNDISAGVYSENTDALQQLAATFKAINDGSPIFGQSRSDTNKSTAFLQDALGGTAVKQAALSGNAEGFFGLAKFLKESGAPDRLVQEYNDLGEVIKDGKIQTERDMNIFLANFADARLKSRDVATQVGLLEQEIDQGRKEWATGFDGLLASFLGTAHSGPGFTDIYGSKGDKGASKPVDIGGLLPILNAPPNVPSAPIPPGIDPSTWARPSVTSISVGPNHITNADPAEIARVVNQAQETAKLATLRRVF